MTSGYVHKKELFAERKGTFFYRTVRYDVPISLSGARTSPSGVQKFLSDAQTCVFYPWKELSITPRLPKFLHQLLSCPRCLFAVVSAYRLPGFYFSLQSFFFCFLSVIIASSILQLIF